MNPSKPSLYLYFAVSILAVFSKLLDWNSQAILYKSLIVPVLFVYYFITNDYKISGIKTMIFVLCFIGDLFNLLDFEISVLGSLLSFLLAYLLLLKLAYNDFKRLRFNENTRIPIFILLLAVIILFLSLFNLLFDELDYYKPLYLIYGFVLSLLIFIVIANYLAKQSYALFYFVIMCICSLLSDIFYLINKFYVALFALSLVGLIAQVISYFFLVNYFIANDRYIVKTAEPN